jgi:hypothetical protein
MTPPLLSVLLLLLLNPHCVLISSLPRADTVLSARVFFKMVH